MKHSSFPRVILPPPHQIFRNHDAHDVAYRVLLNLGPISLSIMNYNTVASLFFPSFEALSSHEIFNILDCSQLSKSVCLFIVVDSSACILFHVEKQWFLSMVSVTVSIRNFQARRKLFINSFLICQGVSSSYTDEISPTLWWDVICNIENLKYFVRKIFIANVLFNKKLVRIVLNVIIIRRNK